MQDVAVAGAFYERKLGFIAVHHEARLARLRRGGVEINLWAANDERWRRRLQAAMDGPLKVDSDTARLVVSGAESFLAGTASCRIEVVGIEELYAEYRAQGVLHRADTRIQERPWGEREFTALDHDRNALTFFECMG